MFDRVKFKSKLAVAQEWKVKTWKGGKGYPRIPGFHNGNVGGAIFISSAVGIFPSKYSLGNFSVYVIYFLLLLVVIIIIAIILVSEMHGNGDEMKIILERILI